MGNIELYENACFWKADTVNKAFSLMSPIRFYRDRLIAGSQEGTWLLPGISILFLMPGFLIPERTSPKN
ncbi:MAG: hypothetical protein KAI77_08085 [Gammaproteobacteria bacterium]|nr:hypothetical protein [Gammaproteobacteria bacterium]